MLLRIPVCVFVNANLFVCEWVCVVAYRYRNEMIYLLHKSNSYAFYYKNVCQIKWNPFLCSYLLYLVCDCVCARLCIFVCEFMKLWNIIENTIQTLSFRCKCIARMIRLQIEYGNENLTFVAIRVDDTTHVYRKTLP